MYQGYSVGRVIAWIVLFIAASVLYAQPDPWLRAAGLAIGVLLAGVVIALMVRYIIGATMRR